MTKFNLFSPDSSFLRLWLTFALFLAASLIPVIGILFLFTLPQVMFILSRLNDQQKTFTAFLASMAFIFVILFLMKSPLPALALLAMGLAGTAMTWVVRKNYSTEAFVLFPSFIMLVAVVLYFVLGAIQASVTPWQLVEQTVRESVELNVSLYSRLPISQDEIQAIKDGKESVIYIFIQIFPALCVISILFTVWLNMLISKNILLKTGFVPAQFTNLTEWKAPAWMIWIFLASGGLLLVPDPQISFAGLNAFLSLCFVYLLQGFAIIGFFFQQKGISPFFRSFFYFFVAIQQILVIAIALLGFLDIWLDFRKFFRNNPESDK